jgi:hypothetical protein
MKSNNIWKIVIGAVSAALGYILILFLCLKLMLLTALSHLTSYCVMLISKYMLYRTWIEMVYLINLYCYEKFCL